MAKIAKQYRLSESTLEKLQELSNFYFGESEKQGTNTLERVLLEVYNELGFECDQFKIVTALNLLEFYKNNCEENGKIMSVNKTAEKVNLSRPTIQNMRNELKLKGYLKIEGKSAYLINY
jgi:hypothetical protein